MLVWDAFTTNKVLYIPSIVEVSVLTLSHKTHRLSLASCCITFVRPLSATSVVIPQCLCYIFPCDPLTLCHVQWHDQYHSILLSKEVVSGYPFYVWG